jgi:hypothetical protein
LVKSVWQKFFSSAVFVVGFVGSQNRLHFLGKSFGKFCFGFLARFYFLAKILVNKGFQFFGILVVVEPIETQVIFWFLLKIKVRAIIFSVLWRWFSFFNQRVLRKAFQQSVHWTLGSLRHLRQFSTPQHFSNRTAFRRPPQRQ